MRHEYYKLVRDKIPQIIEKEGDRVHVQKLSNKDFKNELDLKLQEECKELVESHDISEFADVLEVLEAMAKINNIDWNSIVEYKENKAKVKGTFEDKVFLFYSE
jgi:predicted house-cleaning noncanonical NTP pyrophosphatase (MazG superfamily)